MPRPFTVHTPNRTPFFRYILLFGALVACSKGGIAEPDGEPSDLGAPVADLVPSGPVKVTVTVEGSGRVTSLPQGIDCPGACTSTLARRTRLELHAAPELRQNFMQWKGACAGSNPVCILTLQGDTEITAAFAPQTCTKDHWCKDEPLPKEIGELRKVWGSSDKDVWAVGLDGLMVRFDGLRWYRHDGMTRQGLLGLWGSAATNIWAAGSGQSLLNWDGKSWVNMQTPALPTLFSLWGSGPKDVWTFGGSPFSESFFLRYDGTSWNRITVGIRSTINGIWGSGPTDLWAVGQGGTILHYDGVKWESATSGTTVDLFDVWGSSARDIWAVGGGGLLLRYDGSAWSPLPSGLTNTLRGIWGSDGKNLWAVGDGGALLGYDGTAWKPLASGATSALYGVWGLDATAVWAVGSGVILAYRP